MLVSHDIGGFKTQGLRDNLERLITTTQMNFGYQFMGNLHEIDSRSRSQVLYFNLV